MFLLAELHDNAVCARSSFSIQVPTLLKTQTIMKAVQLIYYLTPSIDLFETFYFSILQISTYRPINQYGLSSELTSCSFRAPSEDAGLVLCFIRGPFE